jgi:hypothetical protein
MRDLQNLINQRALEKCVNDVAESLKDLKSNKYFALMANSLQVRWPEDSEPATLIYLDTLLHSVHQGVGKMLVDKLLPEYIEKESKAFYQAINNLKIKE